MKQFQISPIAHIENDYTEKFGIPRQSGIIASIPSTIVFTPAFQNADALRGIEEFSHLWLIWQFSKHTEKPWSPTVRPPRLGGNARLGVFATRSPFRPNGLGLSCVTLLDVSYSSTRGPLLCVGGADLMHGTPIFDIKPYLPYADAHPHARGGFAPAAPTTALRVSISDMLLSRLPQEKRPWLLSILSHDPRPAYQNNPEKIYHLAFAGYSVHFTVQGDTVFVSDLQCENPSS